MFPYINIGTSIHLGTFGLLLWFAAVCATIVLHKNFVRNGVDVDALNVVTISVLAGIAGAKLWHELQDPAAIMPALHAEIRGAGGNVLFGFLSWFKAGFAWFGGLTAGIAALMIQGATTRPNGLRGFRGAVRMLDLATVATAIGYGVGRIGCLTSGDGDYGKETTLPWGVHLANGPDVYHRALVPTLHPTAAVQPTPIYEFLFALVLAWWLWRRGAKPRPLGFLTGEYLVLSGIGRFLVEFVRINPKIYLNGTFSNAQMAALLTVLAGAFIMMITRNHEPIVATPLPPKAEESPVAA